MRLPQRRGRGTRLTQPPIRPGESFLYEFILPDAGPSGATRMQQSRAARRQSCRSGHRRANRCRP
ncbi:hypothetical protein [Sinorhizobium alkalisoli]|uniref:hypothetical protein n=1 Tax=Sinorhizobium alkalisoli TaxID=1752398 RepID=UPI00315A9005